MLAPLPADQLVAELKKSFRDEIIVNGEGKTIVCKRQHVIDGIEHDAEPGLTGTFDLELNILHLHRDPEPDEDAVSNIREIDQ